MMTLIGTILLLAAAAEPGNLCTLCHPDVRVQYEKSIHSAEIDSCVACHGGDPAASTVDGAHRDDFRGTIGREDVPDLCASCHADAGQMTPYNLPVDQHALYLTSPHGLALQNGDDTVAVCTDCHGVHDILPVRDPAGPTYFQNVPATCMQCHDGESYASFEESIHGKQLLREGNMAAPNCTSCHSAHGAAPPGVGDVNKVCGQCHMTARAYYLDSPHNRAMKDAGLSECASCHGYHDVERTDIHEIESTCAECHAEDSPEFELALQMKTLYVAAEEQIEKAGEIADEAAAVPLYMEDYRARLVDAHTSLMETLPAMHSLDLNQVESLTHRARSIGSEVESEVGEKVDGLVWRRVGLLVFWFYLLLTLAVLVRIRTRAAREIS